MTSKKRKDLMTQFAANARIFDNANAVTLRTQAADSWRELATDAEAKRAPSYLTWTGR